MQIALKNQKFFKLSQRKLKRKSFQFHWVSEQKTQFSFLKKPSKSTLFFSKSWLIQRFPLFYKEKNTTKRIDFTFQPNFDLFQVEKQKTLLRKFSPKAKNTFLQSIFARSRSCSPLRNWAKNLIISRNEQVKQQDPRTITKPLAQWDTNQNMPDAIQTPRYSWLNFDMIQTEQKHKNRNHREK